MVYLFLANGFEEIEALTPLDVLRRAGVQVTTVGVGGDSILGAHGIRVQADIPDTMYRDSAPDMIILPGGMPGSEHLDQSRVVDAALRAGEKNGADLCAGQSFSDFLSQFLPFGKGPVGDGKCCTFLPAQFKSCGSGGAACAQHDHVETFQRQTETI